MGQFTLNGVTYEELPGGKARIVGYANGGAVPLGPPDPMVPLKVQEAQGQAAAAPYAGPKARAQAREAETNAAVGVATAPAEIRGKQAQASKQEVDLRTSLANLLTTGGAGAEQARSGSFYKRALNANNLYAKNRYDISGAGQSTLGREALKSILPDALVNQYTSPERQQAEALQRDFIGATLRYESGAAIPAHEIENQRAIFFPKPGDDPKTVALKAQLRRNAIEGLRVAAGPSAPILDAAQTQIATGATRNELSPELTRRIVGLMRAGRPVGEANALLKAAGAPPIAPGEWNERVKFSRGHPGYQGFEALRQVQTTPAEQLTGFLAPGAAAVMGAGAGLTAGLSDVAGRALGGDKFTAARQALAAEHPVADVAGNVLGGIGTGLAGGLAARAIAPALAASRFAAPLGDVAYGATYGASESPDNPLGGALTGGAAGLGGGILGRGIVRGVGRTIAPTGGKAGPLYEQGVFPTIGQRGAASGTVLGRGINMAEQAMQSAPLLGALPATARQGVRNAFQIGAFNDTLASLGKTLPKGTKPGPAAHNFTNDAIGQAFDTARNSMQFVSDNLFQQEFGQFIQRLRSGATGLSDAQAAQIERTIAANMRPSRGGVMGGEAYKMTVSDLGKIADKWAKSPTDNAMAPYIREFTGMVDDAAARNSQPEAVQLLRNANTAYAKFARIQRASELGGAAKDAGTFTPGSYNQAVKTMGTGLRTNQYSRGQALGQEYAEAGKALTDVLGESGTTPRLLTLGALQGGAGGGLAAVGGLGILKNPLGLAAFAPYAGNIGGKLIAPRELTLPPVLAKPLNLAGHGIYDRSRFISRAGLPGLLAYIQQQ